MIFAYRSNDDGGNEGTGVIKIGLALRQDMDRGEFVFAQQVGQPTETPARDHHVRRGEGEGESLRRCALVFSGVRVGFEGVLNQLAGVKTVAVFLATVNTR